MPRPRIIRQRLVSPDGTAISEATSQVFMSDETQKNAHSVVIQSVSTTVTSEGATKHSSSSSCSISSVKSHG